MNMCLNADSAKAENIGKKQQLDAFAHQSVTANWYKIASKALGERVTREFISLWWQQN